MPKEAGRPSPKGSNWEDQDFADHYRTNMEEVQTRTVQDANAGLQRTITALARRDMLGWGGAAPTAVGAYCKPGLKDYTTGAIEAYEATCTALKRSQRESDCDYLEAEVRYALDRRAEGAVRTLEGQFNMRPEHIRFVADGVNQIRSQAIIELNQWARRKRIEIRASAEPQPDVWDLYDEYRTSLLNMKYYRGRLARWRRTQNWLHAITAVGTSGTIGAWALWKQPPLQYAWAGLLGLVAVFSAVRPFLGVEKRIENSSKAYEGWTSIHYDLKALVHRVKADRRYDTGMAEKLYASLEKERELTLSEDHTPKEKLLRRLQAEVNREIDVRDLWVPGEQNV